MPSSSLQWRQHPLIVFDNTRSHILSTTEQTPRCHYKHTICYNSWATLYATNNVYFMTATG